MDETGAQIITALAAPTSTSWANTSTVSWSGSSGTGAITYTVDSGTNGNTSDPVCQLSGTTLSATGPGTCYVYATIAADTNSEGATNADVAVNFTAIPDMALTNELLNAPMVGIAPTPMAAATGSSAVTAGSSRSAMLSSMAPTAANN